MHGGGLTAPEPEHDASYDPQLVNADCDLAALTADLLRPEASLAVSFLLSGPPGAGKSAWVCQSALNFDPWSARNSDPCVRWDLAE